MGFHRPKEFFKAGVLLEPAVAVVGISGDRKHPFLLTLSSRNGFCIYVLPPVELHIHYT